MLQAQALAHPYALELGVCLIFPGPWVKCQGLVWRLWPDNASLESESKSVGLNFERRMILRLNQDPRSIISEAHHHDAAHARLRFWLCTPAPNVCSFARDLQRLPCAACFVYWYPAPCMTPRPVIIHLIYLVNIYPLCPTQEACLYYSW